MTSKTVDCPRGHLNGVHWSCERPEISESTLTAGASTTRKLGRRPASFSDCMLAHLLLGSDAVRYGGEAEAARAADRERWLEISVSTDVNGLPSLPALQY